MPVDPILSTVIGTVLGASAAGAPLPPPAVQADVAQVSPESALEGTMYPPEPGRVRIDDRIYVLAPGALIRDENNLIILPTMVRVPVRVRYTFDAAGTVFRIWILPAVAQTR